MMNDVVKFLQENPVQYLATVGRDGKGPSAAPSMFFRRDGWQAMVLHQQPEGRLQGYAGQP